MLPKHEVTVVAPTTIETISNEIIEKGEEEVPTPEPELLLPPMMNYLFS
ncbi:hypothetical protein [Deminuibacter soli]|nr:hypothetical protein [Deminuibacter soli]